MLDFSVFEIAGLTVDVVVVYLLNRWYRSKVKDAALVAEAPTFDIGDELQTALHSAEHKTINYACVYGVTEPVGKPLKSLYSDAVGVVHHELLVEHKSRRTQGFWADVKNTIRDDIRSCPFVLVNADHETGKGIRVEVEDALSSEYLRSSLRVTYDQFKQSSDGFLTRSFDRLFGDITKGYQETEKMLAVGVPVLGIGKLVMEGGKRIKLNPPDESRRYILTTSSRSELIRSLKSDARLLRIICWILGLSGAAYLVYFIYRNVSTARNMRRARQLLDEFRLQRRVASSSEEGRDIENQMTCVICLSRQRDVLLLECGHICVCSECALALPLPKQCPICRQSVDRIVPTYIS